MESYFNQYFEENSLEVEKKLCCAIEIRQIFGIIFCLGIGVVWYLFRWDYEVIWRKELVIPLT